MAFLRRSPDIEWNSLKNVNWIDYSTSDDIPGLGFGPIFAETLSSGGWGRASDGDAAGIPLAINKASRFFKISIILECSATRPIRFLTRVAATPWYQSRITSSGPPSLASFALKYRPSLSSVSNAIDMI